MTHVATLISNPAAKTLAAATVERARSALPSAGPIQWLSPGIAADIPFTSTEPFDTRALSDRLRAVLYPQEIDVVVQPEAERRKKLFLADMDSTMIGQECVDELADYVGLKAHVAAITERAMRGEVEFAPALRERVALLRTLPATAIEEVIAKRITLTAVTGGFTLFTERIAGMIGFDENHANRLVLDASGRLTGGVVEPIFGREGKLATLLRLSERLGLSPRDTLAVGDGANDLAMIEAAGLGVAFHAKPKIAAAAAARIDYGDLTALLYAQGYRRDEFVDPDEGRQMQETGAATERS
jgi:phosphoserine phosphatase